MNAFVLDASLTLAWCFEDEATQYTNEALRALRSTKAYAPQIWILEVTNGLLGAKRKERLSDQQFMQKVEFLRALPIQLEPITVERASNDVLPLADEHGLTSYDASYLELARRLRLPIGTLDGSGKRAGLKQAAMKCGIALFHA